MKPAFNLATFDQWTNEIPKDAVDLSNLSHYYGIFSRYFSHVQENTDSSPLS